MGRMRWVIAALASALVFFLWAEEPAKNEWTRFVKTEGQPLQVPEQWLADDEARIAHGLKLPPSAPQLVPFDFAAAKRRAFWLSSRKVAIEYFDHLCRTEASQKIFRTVSNVEGLYFARPQREPIDSQIRERYGLEMPWIQRRFFLLNDTPLGQGWWFVSPPVRNYRFVEQPRRRVDWQADLTGPYIRLFGYEVGYFVKPGQYAPGFHEKAPMQALGIPEITARYGYTWRGLRRERDREFGISGGEVLIYDLGTKEILAMRRQFLIAFPNPRAEGEAMWEVAGACRQLPAYPDPAEFMQFAFDTLHTVKPSSTKKEEGERMYEMLKKSSESQ